MKYLFILNDAAYGTERSYNALRLALSLAKTGDVTITVFLIGDAVSCSVAGQTTPDGYYNLERMLRALVAKGASIGICGTCMDARGLKSEAAVAGTHRSSMDELTQWTQVADRVLVF